MPAPKRTHSDRRPFSAVLAVLLALAGLLAATASVQAQTALVSNIGQTTASGGTTITAQPVTTVSHGRPFELTSVDVQFADRIFGRSRNDVLVRVVPNGTNNRPNFSNSARIITLTNPSSISVNSVETFTAPAGAMLAANTTYHVVVHNSSGNDTPGIEVARTRSKSEDSGAAAGWSIGNERYWKQDNSDSWSTNPTRILQIRVNGTIPFVPTVSNLSAATGDRQVVLSWDAPAAGSGITRHEYRYRPVGTALPPTWTQLSDSAPGGANEDGVTLSNLTNGTSYVFQVRAVDADGAGPAAEVTEGTSPVVTIETSNAGGEAILGLDTVTFKVLRAGSTATSLTVPVTLTQEHMFLPDVLLSESVFISSGQDSSTIFRSANAADLNLTAGIGTLTATVGIGTGYTVGNPSSAEVEIHAAEPPGTVRIERDAYVGSEPETVTVNVIVEMASRFPAPEDTFSVEFRTRNGTAKSGEEYVAVSRTGAGGLIFGVDDFQLRNGVQVARKAQTITIRDDNDVDDGKQFTVLLNKGPRTPRSLDFVTSDKSAQCPADSCTATVTIEDDDVEAPGSGPTPSACSGTVPAGESELWCATLTVGDLNVPNFLDYGLGCFTDLATAPSCSSTTFLSEDEFTTAGIGHAVRYLAVSPLGTLVFTLDGTSTIPGNWKLYIDDSPAFVASSGTRPATGTINWLDAGVELLSNLVYGGLVMRPLYCPR